MRDVQSTLNQKRQTRSAAAKNDSRAQIFAVYGAFLLIATIVFGTLSFRPF